MYWETVVPQLMLIKYMNNVEPFVGKWYGTNCRKWDNNGVRIFCTQNTFAFRNRFFLIALISFVFSSLQCVFQVSSEAFFLIRNTCAPYFVSIQRNIQLIDLWWLDWQHCPVNPPTIATFCPLQFERQLPMNGAYCKNIDLLLKKKKKYTNWKHIHRGGFDRNLLLYIGSSWFLLFSVFSSLVNRTTEEYQCLNYSVMRFQTPYFLSFQPNNPAVLISVEPSTSRILYEREWDFVMNIFNRTGWLIGRRWLYFLLDDL